MLTLTPARQPTLYFIGVTTGSSSIMKVFPAWADFLRLENAVIKGIDFPPGAPAADYRQAVEFIKQDPLSLGALVTTHKIDLFTHCRDLFDGIDPLAALLGETSCLAKHHGKLHCYAKDPLSSGLTLEAFLPPQAFTDQWRDVLILGAGGACIAISWYLMQRDRGRDLPARIIVSDRSAARLEELARLHQAFNPDIAVEYHQVTAAEQNDALLATLRPGSLVINATGMGKDLPGSPIGDAARFPPQAWVWELNYRGDLLFLQQAHAQQAAQQLHIEDGWRYFIHGWTQVIAEVFELPDEAVQGEAFSALSAQAAHASGLTSGGHGK
ncbi:Shikimate dehydrogenase [Paramixta manurensis]|uniref:Shikimate dehydrogenase n=1 Tax=Paramixta manurensis TaxID=2740817 RepID=A0A6M8U4H4_9GAMM|nr:Shikimate dehydrogenase [Erwiniaceae bacterium PD-1]